MSIPVKPWSFSSLDTFVTCPRKYWAEQIGKTVERTESDAQAEGLRQHTAFENRMRSRQTLPDDMAHHEPFMQELEAKGGKIDVELKYGITRKLEPCGFYDADVWHRGIIDLRLRRPNMTATVVDYKSGKPHNKMRQLWLFSAVSFIEGYQTVESMFYWTKTGIKTRIVLPYGHFGQIMQSVVPDLTAYREAFKLDIWPPKRNFLCRQYCGVTECEFHGRGMNER